MSIDPDCMQFEEDHSGPSIRLHHSFGLEWSMKF